jgi:hypothetical protein
VKRETMIEKCPRRGRTENGRAFGVSRKFLFLILYMHTSRPARSSSRPSTAVPPPFSLPLRSLPPQSDSAATFIATFPSVSSFSFDVSHHPSFDLHFSDSPIAIPPCFPSASRRPRSRTTNEAISLAHITPSCSFGASSSPAMTSRQGRKAMPSPRSLHTPGTMGRIQQGRNVRKSKSCWRGRVRWDVCLLSSCVYLLPRDTHFLLPSFSTPSYRLQANPSY